jgi:xanthine dehydrogenase YagR molybdenum-binding subunit
MTTTIARPEPIVGTPMNRVDGHAKVTGQAQYAADAPVEHVAYGAIVSSTIARGNILSIETKSAATVPGVLHVFTHENSPKFRQPAMDFMQGLMPAQTLMPLQGPEIVHYGQQIAIVVAETFEAARAAVRLVEVAYDARSPILSIDEPTAERWSPDAFFGEEMQQVRGDVETALAGSNARIDATYTTPSESHSAMEPHAVIAQWNGTRLVVHEPSQWMHGIRNYLAAVFELTSDDVHVICPFVGGGFGSKGFSLPHTVLAAMAAREVGRPVKLVLTRAQVFATTGHRAQTEQRMRLAANEKGALTAIDHASTIADSYAGWFLEPAGLSTMFLYSCPNVRIRHEAVKLNTPAHAAMRAPGETPGMFALESALDELAAELEMDPVELRIRNDAQTDQHTDLPFSSRHLVECLRMGAERFMWNDRPKEPRRMRDGEELVGWGVATATYGAGRQPASARARREKDGRVVVEVATHDLGTGMYTIMTQVAADALQLPISQVEVRIGDSKFPRAPVAGGSMSTASVMPAVQAACVKLRESGGREAVADAAPGDEQSRYSFHSFGAQFVEVRVDEAIGRVRVSRALGVFDCGKILNPKTTRSQMLGGIIFGIGQALFEENIVDPRSGRLLTDNLAEYRVPVHADIGEIEVLFVEEPDYLLNPLGARGVGEIGITGVAAAIGNAIYHATGKRLRDLPITPEKLL